MSKENILFVIIGLLGGLIIGFMFANSVNQRSGLTTVAPGSAIMAANTSLPPGHPEIPPGQGTSPQSTAAVPEVQAAIDKAKSEP
ncbi:MAG: hypothetical protein ACRD43_05140, partial [Pyrinomonadaceae bacterium]